MDIKGHPVNTLEAWVEPFGPLYQGRQRLEVLEGDRSKGLFGEEEALQAPTPHVQALPPMDINLNPRQSEILSSVAADHKGETLD